MRLPAVVAHADWSSSPAKRWWAIAVLGTNGRYLATAAQPVGDPAAMLSHLRGLVGQAAPIWLGVDFPLGVPQAWAQQVGLTRFTDLLAQWGQPPWQQFAQVAETPDEISLWRPFYPARAGQARQQHLTAALNVADLNALRRRCDLPQINRRAAAPLFWTLGGQQVGKAALRGWHELVVPAYQRGAVRLWPFDGQLATLSQAGGVVLAESYPAEFYHPLGVRFGQVRVNGRFGKRSSADRQANATALLAWTDLQAVQLSGQLVAQIESGFGAHPNGEDAFDAVVGLFGMLQVALGVRPVGDPPLGSAAQLVEGWIFGQGSD